MSRKLSWASPGGGAPPHCSGSDGGCVDKPGSSHLPLSTPGSSPPFHPYLDLGYLPPQHPMPSPGPPRCPQHSQVPFWRPSPLPRDPRVPASPAAISGIRPLPLVASPSPGHSGTPHPPVALPSAVFPSETRLGPAGCWVGILGVNSPGRAKSCC